MQAVEKLTKLALQGRINPHPTGLFPERGEARHPKFRYSARHNPAEMREVGINVDRKAVKGHPALHAHPQSADFGFTLPFADPDSDTPLGAVRIYAELSQSVDHPLFERVHEAPN